MTRAVDIARLIAACLVIIALGALGLRVVALEQRVAAVEDAPAPVLTNLDPIVTYYVADGDVIESMTETVPLWAYVERNDREVLSLTTDVAELDAIGLALVTDPEMRGHLLRHGVTEDELDVLAGRFED